MNDSIRGASPSSSHAIGQPDELPGVIQLYPDASTEPLDVIEANECHYQVGRLCTSRFRRLFNEIRQLRTPVRESSDLDYKLSVAAEDVFMERKRQQMVEGWTIEHDDSHHGGHHEGELALAAASYCMSASADVNPLLTAKARHLEYAEAWWPQHWGRRKPKGARRDLVRAAALIIAEIERLDRKTTRIEGEAP
jgi:hypothetical protein